MLAAVVPVRNEEKRLKKTIGTLLEVPCDLVVPVINGSSDGSYETVRRIQSKRLFPLYFKEALGFDVPRAVGAKAALDRGASAVLFLDGDMDGDITVNLQELIARVTAGGADMALTDCYPGRHRADLSPLASRVLAVRRRLNREMGLDQAIGAASPSHGPHAVSRRLLLAVPLRELAIPPVSLALAAKNGLSVCVGTSVPHKALGSPEKDHSHSQLIAETIIGDCLEAVRVYRGEKRSRRWGPLEYDGYHSRRRWDLLDEFLGQAPAV
ncbi:MAG: glycosyltransferase [Peptococcaceae bacterium]|nr:glycosyltransferase [Peptococcaceae bacterium]